MGFRSLTVHKTYMYVQYHNSPELLCYITNIGVKYLMVMVGGGESLSGVGWWSTLV